jgi:hypothetical protein
LSNQSTIIFTESDSFTTEGSCLRFDHTGGSLSSIFGGIVIVVDGIVVSVVVVNSVIVVVVTEVVSTVVVVVVVTDNIEKVFQTKVEFRYNPQKSNPMN